MDESIIWIYECGNEWKWSPDGLCDRYYQLKEDHKHPAKTMSIEWKEKTGKNWSAGAIQNRFFKLTNSKAISCKKREEYKKKNEILLPQ